MVWITHKWRQWLCTTASRRHEGVRVEGPRPSFQVSGGVSELRIFITPMSSIIKSRTCYSIHCYCYGHCRAEYILRMIIDQQCLSNVYSIPFLSIPYLSVIRIPLLHPPWKDCYLSIR